MSHAGQPDPIADPRLQFYRKVVSHFIPDPSASVLVVGGGPRDKEVFEALRFRNVVFANLDPRATAASFAPYQWSFQDAESLTFADESFDFVVAHAVLHHCNSPHRALIEMYRVARRGALGIEARDSALMRLFERFQLTQTYEHTAVLMNDSRYGGVRNTAVPNFIFRWTEREVEKTINSFAPHARHRFEYHYGHDAPVTAQFGSSGLKRAVIALAAPAYRVFTTLFPKQQNLFAFCIPKPDLPRDLQPWLSWQAGDLAFNTAWAERRYHRVSDQSVGPS
jgi:SAM-dependent methyltransferase